MGRTPRPILAANRLSAETVIAMRILAIETVGTSGSVAALAAGALAVQHELPSGRRSAQALAPGIAAVLAEVGWRPSEVELVAVATGPGSFTGLRIGVTTAKAFAYAVGCQVIGVHSLAAIAARVEPACAAISVVLDAQRGELFVADYTRRSDGRLIEDGATRLVEAQSWIEALTPGSTVTGSGLDRWVAQVPAGVQVVERDLWDARAAEVGRLGWQAFQAGERSTPFDLKCEYLRKAAAEERLSEP
jgi:tRNA threonylcarbamoyladenosine biosynthesis protein TsaB